MAGDNADPVVRLTDVRHRYRTIAALEAVDLELPARQISGLIGPDGVGKSTLLGLIAGVRRIQSGQVRVMDLDLNNPGERTEAIDRIAYMPQGLGRNLYPSLSVHENLDFFGRLFGQAGPTRARRITELTEATGLAEFRHRPAGQLSGGMKQKLALCCALIHEPDLLVLDEPTTGVDPLSRRRFWDLIARLRTRRPDMSVLVSTAYMEEAERFDNLVIMDTGRVLATGRASELKERTGAHDMDSVFIALLPQGRRGDQHHAYLSRERPVSDAQPAIAATRLTRRFGDFVAVDSVSLTIEKGEIFGFLGSNGSGKTTTMRMLVGLLPVSAGEAWVFGRPIDPEDATLRRRLGFMSQSFSLYRELTVHQNLDLHARLYHLPARRIAERVAELVRRFELERHGNSRAEDLPLGVRQRLSLAVAVIHEPELLILDEPTSGVDPVARNGFWELLLELSRERGVTIFISTHFMNEAERCDRISLMHAGRVLAQGAPEDLKDAKSAESLEEAFIAYLEEEVGAGEAGQVAISSLPRERPAPRQTRVRSRRHFSLRRLWAYVRREATELGRDPIRLAFALLGPMFLMIAMGYGISFDVEHIRYAVLDWDRTPASREYLDGFGGSLFFDEQAPVQDDAEALRRLQAAEVVAVIEIPSGFGANLRRGRATEVAVWIDGAVPFRSDTIRGYVEGVHRLYLEREFPASEATKIVHTPVEVRLRFQYNQAFESVYAMVPGILMLLLIMIPATMTAVGVVREKELGSITNLYASPTTRGEFLLGKQLPYVALAMMSYLILLGMSLVLFQVPLKGSLFALTLGALLFVFASTGLGLLMSTFMRTQIAAVFGTAIASAIPTILFSGMLVPVSSLSGTARVMGYGFPSAWFHQVSVGTFTKGLRLADLWLELLVLAAFGLGFFLLGRSLLATQER